MRVVSDPDNYRLIGSQSCSIQLTPLKENEYTIELYTNHYFSVIFVQSN